MRQVISLWIQRMCQWMHFEKVAKAKTEWRVASCKKRAFPQPSAMQTCQHEMTIITLLMSRLALLGRRGVIEDARVPRLPTREACTAPFYRRAQWGFPDMTDSLRKVRYGSSSSYSVAEGYR